MWKKRGVIFAILILIPILIVKYGITDVSPGFFLYKATMSTLLEIGDGMKHLWVEGESCVGEVNRIKGGKTQKIASFSNNKENKEFVIELYNNNGRGEVYVGENKLGFGVYGKSYRKFTAKSSGFCSSWNQSIYSMYFKIPSFVPDNLNYDTVSQSFSSENIAYIILGAFTNLEEADFKNLLESMKVAKMENLEVYNDGYKSLYKHYVVSFPKSDLVKLFKQVKVSSLLDDIKFKSKSITGINSDDLIRLDVLCKSGKVSFAELSLYADSSLWNIAFKNFDNEQIINVTKMSPLFSENVLSVKCKERTDEFTLELSSCSGKIHVIGNKDKNSDTNSFTFILKNNNAQESYVLYVKNNTLQKKMNFHGKDIYSASLSDMYDIYKHFPAIFSIK